LFLVCHSDVETGTEQRVFQGVYRSGYIISKEVLMI
jgi:hypothetical protein